MKEKSMPGTTLAIRPKMKPKKQPLRIKTTRKKVTITPKRNWEMHVLFKKTIVKRILKMREWPKRCQLHQLPRLLTQEQVNT